MSVARFRMMLVEFCTLRTVLFVLMVLFGSLAQSTDNEEPESAKRPQPAPSIRARNNDFKVLDSLLKPYDRRALPTTHLGTPTVVSCSIFIRSFGSINPATMDYETDLYLRQTWTDERLRTDNLSKPLDLNDPKLVQMIWKPEVFFANAKHAEFQFVTVPNVLVRISPGGIIFYMLRLKLRFSCMMDLSKYPMDAQVCAIELASFSKTTDELNLEWSKENPIILYEDLKLPQFQIVSVNTTVCKEKFHIGEYSCLKADFLLQRALGYHMVQSYLPTILIVVISWVSFWLDIEAIPARVTLGVTTLLTISSKGSGIQSSLPPVSYVKAIDVWLGACTSFVFAALLEFTFVNYLWRKGLKEATNHWNALNMAAAQARAGRKESAAAQATAPDPGPGVGMTPGGGPPTSLRGPDGELRHRNVPTMVTATTSVDIVDCNQSTRITPRKNIGGDQSRSVFDKRLAAQNIDRICRVLFPFLFILFNLVYWPYYLI